VYSAVPGTLATKRRRECPALFLQLSRRRRPSAAADARGACRELLGAGDGAERGGRRLCAVVCAQKAAEARQARSKQATERRPARLPRLSRRRRSSTGAEARRARIDLIGASYRVPLPGALAAAAARRALPLLSKRIS